MEENELISVDNNNAVEYTDDNIRHLSDMEHVRKMCIRDRLGLSNASGMFDITGTMLMVYWAFAYGFKSLWIPWLWPVFNQIFLMVYLSVWLRRSNVLTGAEWIKTRFGKGKGATLSHTIVVVFALLSVLGFLSYGFIGIGKFMEIFIPWEVISPYIPFTVSPEYVPHVYGIFFTAIATFYVMLGGMLSIVWTDVVQFLIMTVAGIVIVVIGMQMVAPDMIHSFVPAGWDSPFFGWTLDIDWSSRMSLLTERMANEPYSLIGIFVMMALLKGIFMSMAGPAPNYDMPVSYTHLITAFSDITSLLASMISYMLFTEVVERSLSSGVCRQ